MDDFKSSDAETVEMLEDFDSSSKEEALNKTRSLLKGRVKKEIKSEGMVDEIRDDWEKRIKINIK